MIKLYRIFDAIGGCKSASITPTKMLPPLHWKDSFWQDELLQLDVQWIPEEESLLVKWLQHDGMMIDDDWMNRTKHLHICILHCHFRYLKLFSLLFNMTPKRWSNHETITGTDFSIGTESPGKFATKGPCAIEDCYLRRITCNRWLFPWELRSKSAKTRPPPEFYLQQMTRQQ